MWKSTGNRLSVRINAAGVTHRSAPSDTSAHTVAAAALSRWTRDVESRRGYWKAVVAMAAKNARLAWAVLRRGEDFKLYRQEVPAGA